MKKSARRSGGPLTLTLNRAIRDPGHVVLRRAVSPACPAGQGCSAAVAPARPAPRFGGCLREEDEEGRSDRRRPETP